MAVAMGTRVAVRRRTTALPGVVPAGVTETRPGWAVCGGVAKSKRLEAALRLDALAARSSVSWAPLGGCGVWPGTTRPGGPRPGCRLNIGEGCGDQGGSNKGTQGQGCRTAINRPSTIELPAHLRRSGMVILRNSSIADGRKLGHRDLCPS